MTPSCRTCNLQKGPRTPAEWYQSLQAWLEPYEQRLREDLLQVGFG
jgi:hypothetical protein